MNFIRNLYEQTRESRIAITAVGLVLAALLFVGLVKLTSNAPNTALTTTTTAPASTTTTTIGTPTPGPRIVTTTTIPLDQQDQITTFDTQLPSVTVGPNGEQPVLEGQKGIPLSATTAAVVAQVATDFTTAWGKQKLPKDQWIAGIQPYAIGDYYTAMNEIGPSGDTEYTVTGPGVVTSLENPIEVQVPTDHGTLLVTISSVLLPSGMVRVLDLQPLSSNADFG